MCYPDLRIFSTNGIHFLSLILISLKIFNDYQLTLVTAIFMVSHSIPFIWIENNHKGYIVTITICTKLVSIDYSAPLLGINL